PAAAVHPVGRPASAALVVRLRSMSKPSRARLEFASNPPREWSGATKNAIVRGLPAADRARLTAALQPVTFDLGHVISEPGRRMDYIYFPTTAVVSSLYTTEEGATAEMGLAGNDGVVGVSLFLGGGPPPNPTVASAAGGGLPLQADAA